MIEITARDVVGTAASNAHVATRKLESLLNKNYNPEAALISLVDSLSEVANSLAKALSDVKFAQHILDPTWTDTTYVGRWS